MKDDLNDLTIKIIYNGHELEREFKVEEELPEKYQCEGLDDMFDYLTEFDNETQRIASEFH